MRDKSIVLQCGPGRIVDVVPCFPTLQPRCWRTVHSLLYRSQARWCQRVEIRVRTMEEVQHCERDHQPAPCDGMFTDSMDHFQVWCGIHSTCVISNISYPDFPEDFFVNIQWTGTQITGPRFGRDYEILDCSLDFLFFSWFDSGSQHFRLYCENISYCFLAYLVFGNIRRMLSNLFTYFMVNSSVGSRVYCLPGNNVMKVWSEYDQWFFH